MNRRSLLGLFLTVPVGFALPITAIAKPQTQMVVTELVIEVPSVTVVVADELHELRAIIGKNGSPTGLWLDMVDRSIWPDSLVNISTTKGDGK